jgi:hypothetical protein
MTPLRTIAGHRADIAIVSDPQAARAYARELEARERAEAMRLARPAILRLLDLLANAVLARRAA